MGLSSVELWQRIAASQLASPLLCRTWAADAATALSATEAIDGQRVGQQLVSQGKLTQFQIDSLLSDNPLPLIRNGYRLLEPVNYAPYPAPHVRSIWNEWWAVAKTPTSPTLWMRWIQADDFKQPALAQSNPALPRALQQSQVRHELLQAVQPPEMAAGTLQLCVEPVQGTLLSGLCDGTAKSREAVWSMMTEVASALAPLHAAGLAHGRVTPDRIYVSETGQHRLLRDPLCSATLHMQSGQAARLGEAEDSPSRRGGRLGPSGLLAAQLPAKLDAVHFMAPEFLLPAQIATPQSDMYGLGCVAWLMLTGSVPYTAKQPEQVLAAQAEQPLDLTRLGDLPEPLTRCLLHCLAKNPGARFQQAGQLVAALQEAQRVVARGKITPAKPAAAAKAVATVKAAPTGSVAVPSVPSKPVESKPVESKPVETKQVAKQLPAKEASEAKPLVKAPVAATPTPASESKPKVKPSTPSVSPVAAAAIVVVPNAPKTDPVATTAATPAIAETPSSPSLAPTAAAQPTAAQPQKRLAQPGKPPGRRSPVRKTKKNKGVNWLTPVIGGGALLVLILIVTVMSGGFGSSSSNNTNTQIAGNNTKGTNQPMQPAVVEPAPVDPIAERYELVSDVPTALWAPPHIPEPIPLDLLPPGGQFFACLRPAKLMSQADAKQLLSLLDTDLSPLWKSITETSGVSLEQIDQVVLAAYPAENSGPQTALRIKLKESLPLSQLKGKWQSPVDTKVKEHALLVSGPRAFYIKQQPLVDSQSVTEFSVGPTELMREAAEKQGVGAVMSGQMEQLHQATDKHADINLLVNPVFFYTEGRTWLDQSPPRFRAELEKWATRDLRSMMFSTSFSDPWYYELRLIGATDRESIANMQKLNDAKRQLPQAIESWLVSELPHPHWRAMANRFPNMLRAFDTQTRIGSENGQAIVNGYLPLTAAPNLIYASWMAVQPGSTASTGTAAATATTTTAAATTPALTPEQILDRKITLVMDQTGIENVLQAIGEQANDKLPAGTKPLRFELDGAGFQRAGITRNQQVLGGFDVKDQTVRQALIVLSKKGNPVKPLDDIKSDDQKLIWVLINGDNPDKALLSLTSREAALAANYKLPAEYVK